MSSSRPSLLQEPQTILRRCMQNFATSAVSFCRTLGLGHTVVDDDIEGRRAGEELRPERLVGLVADCDLHTCAAHAAEVRRCSAHLYGEAAMHARVFIRCKCTTYKMCAVADSCMRSVAKLVSRTMYYITAPGMPSNSSAHR